MKKMHKVTILILAILTPIVLGMILMTSNPLRQSPERIRNNLLELMPIGISMGEVLTVIEDSDRWTVRHISEASGVLMLDGRPSTPSHLFLDDERIIGEQRIVVMLGEYRTILMTSVVAYFAFDSNGYLLEIAIRKYTDTL